MLDITPFLSTNPLRPIMNAIFYDGEWANATNAHIAIRWPHITEEITEKAPDVKKLFDEHVESETFLFDKNEYRQWLNTLPLVDEEIDCDVCYGKGNVEWEFTSPSGRSYSEDHDCPACGGDGRCYTDNKVPDTKINYKLAGAITFSQANLSKVLLVMDFADVDTCYFSRALSVNKGCLVKIDMYQILIMPIIL